MKKLPYIRQGQQLTIDILNGIIKAINSSILERKEYDSMMADITRMFNSYQSKVDNFILKYQDVVDNTPGLMDLLQSYSTLASMVNGTYVASVGSVNITVAGFDIQRKMGRAQFEDEQHNERTYPQYSSLLIEEITGATTLVYNVAPFEGPPTWIEIDAIAGPQGPPGPPGLPGPRGENGEDGEPGQITSIKGKKASLEECLSLDPAPASGDAYVVDNGDDGITLYVYFDEDLAHTDPNSWVALNNIRGPAGPQGEMAEISIQYSNYADGSHASDVYNSHSFMIISEDGGSTRHVIKLTPAIDFRIVDIEESTAATTPSADVSRTHYPNTNETIINTKITIPYLRTVESASLVGNNLHLKYRGIEETTPVGRVVYDPAKIIFTNGFEGFNIDTLKDGDVIIDVSDNYKIFNYIGGTFREQGALQGPPGPVGPVGASFNLIGNWVTYGNTSTGAVTPSAGNVGNAYFLPEDDGGHRLGIYVSSETSPGVYDWVFAGNSQGPEGATGATGPIGPRGARITSGTDFYLTGETPTTPANTGNTYKQNDLYLNTTSWDLFEVTAIGSAPNYTISAVRIGNIKGLGITNITVDEAAENLTVTYSGGSPTVVPIRTIRVADTEYDKAGLVVHKTDTSAKGVFAIDYTIGEQSDPEVPASFNLWGNETHLKAPSGAGSAGNSTLIPRADHVHPAPATATTATNLSLGALGSVPYQTAAGATDFIGVNTSTTKKFLSQTGTGSVGAKPAWGTLTTSDITDLVIETSQSPSEVKVPSSKLLKESSFARVYRSFADLGIPNSSTIAELHSAMIDRSRAIISVSTYNYVAYSNTGLELPNNLFYVLEAIRSDNERLTLKLVGKASNSAVLYQYEGMYWKYGDSDKFTGWKRVIDDSTYQKISGVKEFTASPIVPTTPSGPSSAVAKAYADSLRTVYDKVIRTQTEFNDLINSGTWLDAKSVAIVGQFTLDTENNSGIEIPATVKQIHGFNGAKITITDFVYNVDTAKGGLWYATAPTTLDYSIRDLEVSCTGTTSGRAFYNCSNLSNCTGTATGTSGYGFSSCNNLSNCMGTGTGTVSNGFGFSNCNNLSNCTGTGTATNGYGFYIINYAVNCKDGGSSTDMWYGTNNNIDVETCRKTPAGADNATLNT